MTAEQVAQLADAKATADKEAGSHYYLEGSYHSLDEVIEALSEQPEVMANERVRYIHATYKNDFTYEVFIIKTVSVTESSMGKHVVRASLYALDGLGIYSPCPIEYEVDEASGNYTISFYEGIGVSFDYWVNSLEDRIAALEIK